MQTVYLNRKDMIERKKIPLEFIRAHGWEMGGIGNKRPTIWIEHIVDAYMERRAHKSQAEAMGGEDALAAAEEASRLLDHAIADGKVAQIGERRILGEGGKGKLRREAAAR